MGGLQTWEDVSLAVAFSPKCFFCVAQRWCGEGGKPGNAVGSSLRHIERKLSNEIKGIFIYSRAARPSIVTSLPLATLVVFVVGGDRERQVAE